MIKKSLILFSIIIVFLTTFNLSLNKEKYCFAAAEDQKIREKIFETKDKVDEYIKKQYGSKTNFAFTTTHNVGVLSTRNADSWWLTYKYNNMLEWSSVNNKLDLNRDGVINSKDDLGKENSICSPTAAAIIMRYLVLVGKINYTPRIKYDLNGSLTDSPTDVFNVFYELVDSYISCGWQGSATTSQVELDSMNHFLKKNNSSLTMNFSNKNMIDKIKSNFDRGLPCVGHIVSENSDVGHTFTIAGYYTKEITYTEKVFLITQSKKVNLHFLVINTGWTDSTMGDSGGSTQEEYDENYSYVLLDDVYNITYFI